MPRPLTNRQTAVLAAVERIGRPIIFDMSEAFPDLAPSAIGTVLDALEKRGLVAHAGPDGERYAGGVTWWSTREPVTPPSAWTAGVLDAVRGTGAEVDALPGTEAVRVRVPRVEVESFLVGGPSTVVEAVRHAIVGAGVDVRATLAVGAGDGPESEVHLTLTPGPGDPR